MNYATISLSVATVFVTLAAVLIARKALRLGMLKELMRTYSTPETGDAVRTLWDFYKDCDKNSNKVHGKFKGLLEAKNDQTKIINDSRRSVSHFYQLMAAMYHRRVVDSKLLFKFWQERDLKIIRDVIIPLEKALFEYLEDESNNKTFELLNALYEASAKEDAKNNRNHNSNRQSQPGL